MNNPEAYIPVGFSEGEAWVRKQPCLHGLVCLSFEHFER